VRPLSFTLVALLEEASKYEVFGLLAEGSSAWLKAVSHHSQLAEELASLGFSKT